ncbi:unnamed protein product [Sphagnum balticum]
MASASSCQVHPQIISPCSSTKRELYAMVMDLNAMVMDLKAGLNENKFELKEFKDLGREWSRNDLIVCAVEILKWSVKLRGEKDGDGRQFFRDDLFPLVAAGSKAMGMTVSDYQHLSRRCFNLRNSTVHFDTLEVLESAVALCSKGVKVFPDLRFDLVDQCAVVEHFKDFKRLLPQSFK